VTRRQFGSLRRLSSGRWQASYWQGGTRHLAPRTFETKTEARTWLSTVESDLVRGDWINPTKGRLLFEVWAEMWRSTLVHLRPSTLSRDLDYLDRYIVPRFGKSAIADISVMDVRSWVAELGAGKLAPATVVKAGQILSKVMRAAVEAGLLRANPCASVTLPRVERREMRFLGPAEVNRLADAIDPRYGAVILLAAYGGLRAGELFGLKVERVNLEGRYVDVLEQVVEVEGRLHFGAPKTRAGRRRVPLPRVVIEALKVHLEAAQDSEFLFSAPDGGPVRLASWRSRYFLPATRKAGVEPLRVHDLRHTAVALWIAAGATPREIANRAGHTSVSVVLDRYGHLLPGSGDQVDDELDRLAAAATNDGTTIGRRRARVAHVGRHHLRAIREKTDSPGETEWALEDSNLRPQPCEGCALTN
jgi:integrase